MLNSTVKKTLIVVTGTALAAGAAYLAVRNFDAIASTASDVADSAGGVAEAVTEVAVSALSASASYAGELV